MALSFLCRKYCAIQPGIVVNTICILDKEICSFKSFLIRSVFPVFHMIICLFSSAGRKYGAIHTEFCFHSFVLIQRYLVNNNTHPRQHIFTRYFENIPAFRKVACLHIHTAILVKRFVCLPNRTSQFIN